MLPFRPITFVLFNLCNKRAWSIFSVILLWIVLLHSQARLKVRIRGIPVEEDIRMLRQVHLNMLIKVTGVVTITTGTLEIDPIF